MSFRPFTRVTGIAAPLLRPNVDTDVIIRVERLTTRDPGELGRHAFEALRYRDGSSEEPSFILNRPPFRDAPILVAGANFGCGSSREPAVWALVGLGIRCVVAPSFGDIFFGNCIQNGLLPVALDAATVSEIGAHALREELVTVDLEHQEISAASGASWAFQLDAPLRESLLHGLDDIERALAATPLVKAWEARDRIARPWALPRKEDRT